MQKINIESVGIYNSKIAKPNIVKSNLRRTAFFELELPLENGGTSFINIKSQKITTDTFICAKPNSMRRTEFPFMCYYVHLYVSDEYLYTALMSLPDFIKIKDLELHKSIFRELCSLCDNSDKYCEIMRQSLILKLIYTLCTQYSVNRGSKHNCDTAMSEALRFIGDNLTEHLTLSLISKHVLLSPVYFHNCFKKTFGKTVHKYVEEQRIKKSIELMLTTDMNLTQIAYSCGFSSQSYFSSVFKREMNTTPRKYILAQIQNYKI